MRFEERRPPDHEASILPLINVVFLLLIFFMIAGSLDSADPFEVQAPESTSEGLPETPLVTLLLGADGQLAMNGETLGRDALLAGIRERIAHDPRTEVQLKADADIAGNRLVLFTEDLNAAGVTRLRLLTLPATR